MERLQSNSRINTLVQRGLLLAVYLGALYAPWYFFWDNRGGFAPGDISATTIFPLLGLYAFTFVTFQVLIATNLRWLQKLWPGIIRFHRTQGVFALLFALLHPLFILVGFGLASAIAKEYVSQDLAFWVIPGITALSILLFTVGTAVYAWNIGKLWWWRKLHRLNYLIFIMVWVHSFNIGSDLQTPELRRLWVVYLIAVIVSVIGMLLARGKVEAK